MRTKHITYSPTILDADSVCALQTKAAAGALLINGAYAVAGVALIPIPRHLSIYAAANESLITFTIVGKDRYGKALTEARVGPTAGATVKLAYNFASVSSVTVSGALTGNITVGTADEFETPWIPLDTDAHSVDMNVSVSTGGSMNAILQSTSGDIWNAQEKDLAAVTSAASGASVPAAARLKITAFVSGTVTLSIAHHRS